MERDRSLVGKATSADVEVLDSGSSDKPGRVRFDVRGRDSALRGEVEVTVCPIKGSPPPECVVDEECADGQVCRRDSARDSAKKTKDGVMGTFGDLGRCVAEDAGR